MNVIQPEAQLSNSVALLDTPVNTKEQGKNGFARALENQQSSDSPVIAKAQTKSARGSSQGDLNAKNPVQNWTSDAATSALPVVPIITEFAKSVPPAVAPHAAIASSTREPETTDVTGSPLPVNALSSWITSHTSLTFKSILGNSPAAAPISVAGKSSIGKPAAYSEQTASAVAASQSSIAPVIATIPSTGLGTATDRSTVAAAECDQQADPTQRVGQGTVRSQFFSDPEISVQDFQSSTAAPEFGPQQFDPATPDTSQTAPQSDLAEPLPDGMPPAQPASAVPIDSNRQLSPVEPYIAKPINSIGIEVTEVSADRPKNPSPHSHLATTPGNEHESTSTITAAHTFPIRLNPGQASGVVHQENEPATHIQTRPSNFNSGQSASPKIIAVSPLNDVSRLTLSSAPTDTHVVVPKAAFDADKVSGEPRSSCGQGVSGTGSSDISTKTTPTINPQTGPPATPSVLQAQDRTVEDPNSITAINLVTPTSKLQQGPNSAAAAERSALAPPTDQPQSQPVNAGVVAARIVEGVGQSDMRIGLRTQAFGAVNVHTALRDAEVGLAVSSERGDLRSFFSSEIPALQTVLRQHDLHFDTIRFIQQGTSGSASSGDTNSESHSFHQPQPSMRGFSPDDAKEEEYRPQDISLEVPARLSVHA
jgi:hypothetical protein